MDSGEIVPVQANYLFVAHTFPALFTGKSPEYMLPSGWVVPVCQAVQLYLNLGFNAKVDGFIFNERGYNRNNAGYALQVIPCEQVGTKSIRLEVKVKRPDGKGEETVAESAPPAEPPVHIKIYVAQVNMLIRMINEAVDCRCIACGAKVEKGRMFCPRHIGVVG